MGPIAIVGKSRKWRKHIRYTVAGFILLPVLCNLALSHEVIFHPASSDSEFRSPRHFFNHSKPTLVIQLRGEMGNHLSSIAHGMGVRWYAKEMYEMELEVLLRHQVLPTGLVNAEVDSPKWKPTSDAIKQCFPNLRSWTFDRGSAWKEFYSSNREQMQWLAPLTRNHLDYINGRLWQGTTSRRDPQPVELQDWNKSLTTLQTLMMRSDRPASRVCFPSFFQCVNPSVSIPFLRSESLENTLVVNRFLDDIRKLFRFDYDTCCGGQSPYQDETVLHFRNFIAELPGSDSGLEDVSPQQTAHVLLHHLQAGDKVAMTTRIHNEQSQRHVNALRAKGVQVRVIEGQSASQDFCFLLQAKKELVGNFQSTFFFWAAVLGQAATVRLYTLDNPRLRERCGWSTHIMMRRFMYNWTHPELMYRFHQILIPLDDEGLEETNAASSEKNFH